MPAKQYNAFISYAWVDNQPFAEGRAGWVSTFVDRLRKHLGRELRRQTEGDRVFLDYERLRGNEPLSAAIRGELSASRLLVPIISPAYFASLWCRQELETFLTLRGEGTDRVFPVWMEPVEPDDVPEEARPLAAAVNARLKYSYWYLDEARQVRTRWFPEIDATDREFGRIQQKMAREMAGVLRPIIKEEAAEQAVPEPAQTPPAVTEGEHLILVNGGEADADWLTSLADRLWNEHQIGSVVPLVAQKDKSRYKSSELIKDLRENLGLCTCVLLLNCLGPHQQVYQQLKEYQRTVTRLPTGKLPPSLILCHGAPEPLTFRPPGMRVLPVNGDCAGDCLRAFIAELAG